MFIICASLLKQNHLPMQPSTLTESTMFLTLSPVELLICHRRVAASVVDNCGGSASAGAFNDGAPPGVPVS